MLTFLSAELITGQLRAELPLSIDSDLSRFLGDVGEGTFLLPVRDPACPADWLDHVRPWRSLLVAVDDTARVVWAGVPNRLIRNPLDPVVQVQCVTVEGYLDRRYVPSLEYRGTDQTSGIARALAGIAGDNVGIGLEYDTPHSGVFRDRAYYDDESATVLERLQQLATVIDGFEWTIDVDWTDSSQTAFTKTFRTGYPHIGRVTGTPNPVFELPGAIVAAELSDGWGTDQAATHVIATGDGEGESKAMSAPVVDAVREGAGWPRLEHRRSFSSVTTQSVIDAHAGRVAAQMFGGEELLTITSRIAGPPRFGAEWNLGDSVRVIIATDTVDLEQVWRVVGWHLRTAEGNIEPIIARVRGPLDEDWIWQ